MKRFNLLAGVGLLLLLIPAFQAQSGPEGLLAQSENAAAGLGNFQGDGDVLDVLTQAPPSQTPRAGVWLTPLRGSDLLSLDRWTRQVIDPARPWRALFIQPADLNGDSLPDVVTGGWWYPNPGTADGVWERRTLGDPLNNAVAVADFDGDGDLDVLGTDGQETGGLFSWAENDGQGNFSVHPGIAQSAGDTVQGVTVGRFQGDALQVMLSWQQAGPGIERLTVPADPAGQAWPLETLQPASQDGQLSAGDIDGDGDPDLLLGTTWLRNDGDAWTPLTLFETADSPIRNRLADFNADGRLDAVVGYEVADRPGKLAWYAQGEDPAAPWTEHTLSEEVFGPMSLDVADMDGDGDPDVIVGEHNQDAPASARLFIFENVDGRGDVWLPHTVYMGEEHYHGAQVVDIDLDGDLDILSIGWGHSRVVLYENLGTQVIQENPTPGTTPESGRVTAGLQVLYTFMEGAGTTVIDRAGRYGLDLTISDPGAVHWLEGGGLAVDSSVMIEADRSAAPLVAGIQATGALTLEAWIRPANVTQDGPARILALSSSPNERNFTLGEGLYDGRPADVIDVRLRTTATDANGEPSLTTVSGTLTAELTHVVYTRDASGQAIIYLDGRLARGEQSDGGLDTWDPGYRLLLANEVSGDRPWLGELYLVAIYDRALSDVEVVQNFSAGWEASGG